MDILSKLFGGRPFQALVEHTKKVHECVSKIRPLAEALLAQDWAAIDRLQREVSRLEHEADRIKDKIRVHVSQHRLLAVNRDDIHRFLTNTDKIADGAENFGVVLTLRHTAMHPALRDEFLAFVDKVIEASEALLAVGEQLNLLSEAAFTGKEAEKVSEGIQEISRKEWEADILQQNFAKHSFAIEKELDPVTLFMYDKFCYNLSFIANSAENAGNGLRSMIEKV